VAQGDAQPAGGGSTVEITRSRATRRAILKVPGRSPASTSSPATSASSATASACSAPSSASPPPRARPARVVDQPRYQRLLGVGVVPVAVGLARPVVVVGAQLDRTGCRDQPTDPTDRRDQLGDRILGGDRILQHRGVQHPPAPPPKHPGRLHHLADGIEDPPRPLRAADTVAPVHQHRGMEPLVVQPQPAGDLHPQIPTIARHATSEDAAQTRCSRSASNRTQDLIRSLNALPTRSEGH